MNEKEIYENHHGMDRPDLHSAALEREKYYDFHRDKFILAHGCQEKIAPNDMRVWSKKNAGRVT